MPAVVPAVVSVSPERVGLCSVTLRALPADEVINVAAAAGLRCVEWGADVHAPPGDDALAALGDRTAAAGLRVCSYGSYWRAGASSLDELAGVAAAASVLGTSRIRIWAGTVGTDAADRSTWLDVVTATRRAACVAADHGCSVAFEFHGDTLTDTVDSTLRLIDEVDRPDVSTYWQPPLDVGDDDAIDGLERLVDRVTAVHAFSWWPGATRRHLDERADLWRRVGATLTARRSAADVLLEFVPGDDPALVAGEAASLREALGPTADRRR